MTSDSLQRHKHADHAALVIAQDHGGSASKVKTRMAHGNVDYKVIVGFSDCTCVCTHTKNTHIKTNTFCFDHTEPRRFMSPI